MLSPICRPLRRVMRAKLVDQCIRRIPPPKFMFHLLLKSNQSPVSRQWLAIRQRLTTMLWSPSREKELLDDVFAAYPRRDNKPRVLGSNTAMTRGRCPVRSGQPISFPEEQPAVTTLISQFSCVAVENGFWPLPRWGHLAILNWSACFMSVMRIAQSAGAFFWTSDAIVLWNAAEDSPTGG